MYDKQGNGTIEAGALADVLRSLGQNPTNAQINALTQSHPKPFTFDEFHKIMSSNPQFKSQGSLEQFVQGFQVFDKDNNGLISSGELRYVLTSLGEKLSDEEVDDLLKLVEVDKNGYLNYENFVRTIMNG